MPWLEVFFFFSSVLSFVKASSRRNTRCVDYNLVNIYKVDKHKMTQFFLLFLLKQKVLVSATGLALHTVKTRVARED